MNIFAAIYDIHTALLDCAAHFPLFNKWNTRGRGEKTAVKKAMWMFAPCLQFGTPSIQSHHFYL